MKTFKKLIGGLVLALLSLGIFALFTHTVAAATSSDDLDKATYKLDAKTPQINGTIGGKNVPFFDSNPGDGTANFKPKDNAVFCGDTLYGHNGIQDALLGITIDKNYKQIVSNGGAAIQGAIEFNYLDNQGNCQVYENTISFVKQSDGSYVAKQQPAGSNTSQTTDNDTCEANSGGFTMAWVTCPLLTAAGDAITGPNGEGGLLGYFQDQLSFSVSKDLGDSTSQNQVKVTWGIFKNIATAILVIVMLLMVYSQATGNGPFEAYTTRKMLPRLVAIAILMQLSWVVMAWIIELFNDLGGGLADLMYAPFGGSSNLTIFSLLSHAGLGTTGAVVINWVGIIALLTIGVAAAPTVMLFALAAAAALLTAFFVLIFRKIIIILCLITAPLALAAYLLPGAQRYWKLWFDNFIKVLAMYPLIVALIAAGRIFAYIVSSQNNGGVLVSFIFIIVGFFGPLFMLPKAFRWGGTLMAAGGGAITGAVNRFGGKESLLGKGVQGYGERWQGAGAKQYNPEAGLRNRTLRRIQSGHILPTERSRRLTIAAGDKWANERNDEATALVGRTYEKALGGYDRVDLDEDGNYLAYARQRAKNADGQFIDEEGNAVDDESKATWEYLDGFGPGAHVVDKKLAARTRVATLGEATTERIKGVAAGKQALIDIAGNDAQTDPQKRAAQAAVKQLIDTHSEIELQGARIGGAGLNAGKRASEVGMWRDTITNSPPHYTAINNSRPDMAPDVIEGAQKRANDTYELAYQADNTHIVAGTELTDPAGNIIPGTGLTDRQVRVQKLDRSRLSESIDRLSPETLQRAHYGFFDDIAKLNDPALSEQLRQRLVDFRDNSGPAGQSAVGALRGGKAGHVDAALHASGVHLGNLDTPVP